MADIPSARIDRRAALSALLGLFWGTRALG